MQVLNALLSRARPGEGEGIHSYRCSRQLLTGLCTHDFVLQPSSLGTMGDSPRMSIVQLLFGAAVCIKEGLEFHPNYKPGLEGSSQAFSRVMEMLPKLLQAEAKVDVSSPAKDMLEALLSAVAQLMYCETEHHRLHINLSMSTPDCKSAIQGTEPGGSTSSPLGTLPSKRSRLPSYDRRNLPVATLTTRFALVQCH